MMRENQISAKSPSEVLDLPNNWQFRKIGTYLEKVDQRTDKPDARLLSVSKYSGVKPREELVTDREFRADSTEGYKVVKKGDLVVNIMLAWDGALGVSEYNGVVSPSYEVYRMTERGDPFYFHHLMRTKLYQYEFTRHSTGIRRSRWRLYKPQFFSIDTPFPPAKDQEKIASYIEYRTSLFQKIIRQKEKLLDLLGEKVRTTSTELLEARVGEPNIDRERGPEWKEKIPHQWKIQPLYSISNNDRQTIDPTEINSQEVFHYSLVNYEEKGDGDYEDPSEIDSKKLLLEGGEVLISKLNPENGQVLVAESHEVPTLASTEFVPLIPDPESAYPGWLFLFLSTEYVRQYLKGISKSATHSHKRVKPREILSLRSTIPPLEEQKELIEEVRVVRKTVEETMKNVRKELDLLKEKREALITAAVTGQIDLSDWEHPEDHAADTQPRTATTDTIQQ